MNINKNIAVWRGDNVPPTIYHIWIKSDNSIWLYKKDRWANINQETQESLSDIYEVLYNQHSQISFTSDNAIIERGVPSTVNLNWAVRFNGNSITPQKTILKSGGTTLIEDSQSYSETITDTKRYDLTVMLEYNIQKQQSIQVNAYYPMFFGSSVSNNVTGENILSFIKQNIKSNPSGNYSLTVLDNQYVWLCIPNNMSINKVTSSGFDVPMEAPITVTVPGKDIYKCYRSQNTFKAGIFNFTIV